MAKSATAIFALTLIGGILVLLVALFLLAAAYLFPSIINAEAGTQISGTHGISTAATSLTAAASAEGIIGLISGIVLIVSAVMIRRGDASKIKKFSILALVFSIISFFGGAGFYIGLVLALIGSILGLLYKEK
ncbi:MAG: hypothetical protein KGH66_04205 [Candidatus Micrarchaeota archaeon]|nr:hypothetical protein [Candidatus Micrarchaeota archaeon]